MHKTDSSRDWRTGSCHASFAGSRSASRVLVERRGEPLESVVGERRKVGHGDQTDGCDGQVGSSLLLTAGDPPASYESRRGVQPCT